MELSGNIDNGLELRQASTWDKSVDISSKVSVELPITRFRWNLVDLTPASQKPPKLGEWGGMKCQEVLLLPIHSLISTATEDFSAAKG